MKLRYSPTSPYVRKVVMVAIETGLNERIERLPTMVVPTRVNEEVARENPLVKVPALTTDDGLVLYDSPVICEYLDTLHSGPKLFPEAGAPRWIALRHQALADGILDAAILIRYEGLRPQECRWADWIDGQTRKMRGALAQLDLMLEAGELGSGLTIGQIAIGCALGYLDFRFSHEDWRGRHRRLAGWFDDFAQRKSMRDTVPADPV